VIQGRKQYVLSAIGCNLVDDANDAERVLGYRLLPLCPLRVPALDVAGQAEVFN
jgi:hypothetical protein